jgi:hypothetical protein
MESPGTNVRHHGGPTVRIKLKGPARSRHLAPAHAARDILA